MKKTAPSQDTTKFSPEYREWIPNSFESYLREMAFLTRHCNPENHPLLFRGHTYYQWLLDCTLVRSILSTNPRGQNEYPRPIYFHTNVVDILLSKFGKSWQPSLELLEVEQSQGVDSWYELMKKLQQYSEEDMPPPGTFLIDWTQAMDVALYFATFRGRGDSRKPRDTPGAVWIYDPTVTGKVLQTQKLRDLLNLMRGDEFRLKAERTMPLILHPPKQTVMDRAVNQAPVYVAQMDFRYDMADIWGAVEDHSGSAVFRKIILTHALLQDSIEYLEERGISEEYVYPE